MLPYLYISGDNHMCSQPATITYYHIWRTINHSGKANSLSFYGHIDILVFMIIIRDKAVRPHFNIISYFHISYGTDTREHTYGRPFADLNFAPPLMKPSWNMALFPPVLLLIHSCLPQS